MISKDSLPKPISRLISFFDRLPGIGPKSAARLAFYMLRLPEEELKNVSAILLKLKRELKKCRNCFHWSTDEICPICSDPERNQCLICVVEDSLDLIAIERCRRYKGVYHVLEGVISPLDGVEAEDLRVKELIDRVKKLLSQGKQMELIIATNPTMEGEATAMYIRDLVKNIEGVRVTRLAQGLPTGADIEYADQLTILRALEQRSEYR